MKEHINIFSLGCSKNLVDSERLARRFSDLGIEVAFDEDVPPRGSTVIVNTCGFIGDAKEESVFELLRFLDLKKRKHVKAVYVMGCLSERYRDDVAEQMPELDGIYGKFDWQGIIDEVLSKRPLPRKTLAAKNYPLPHTILISRYRKAATASAPSVPYP